jgi:membrane protease YdiL (CAAX protease family)
MPAESLLFDSVSPETAAVVVTLYFLLLLAGTVVATTLIIRSFRTPVDWAPRILTLKSRPWTWREGLAVAAIVGLLICLSMAAAALLKHPRETTLIIMQSIVLDLAGIAAIAWMIIRSGWTRTQAFGMEGTPFRCLKPAVLFYLAVMPFLFFSSLVYQGVLSLNGIPPSLQDIAMLLSADQPLWMRLYMIFLAVAVAPVFEECLFRGILLPLFSRRLGMGAGIFMTSLLFASIHFHLPSLIPLMVVAAGFSLAYVYSGSLWVPILMHGMFNGVNLALLLAMRQ